MLVFVGCGEKKQPVVVNQPEAVSESAFTTIKGTTNITANGVSVSRITITLADSNQVPLVGVIPTFDATDTGSTNSYSICSETDSSGVSTCTLTSTKAETKTLRITSPDIVIGDNVEFIAGDKAKLGFSTEPSSSVLVGVNLSSQPIVQVQDANSNPVVDTIDTITLNAYTNSSCTTTAPGVLSVTTNPLTTNGATGLVTFSGVSYSKWETLYIGASASGLVSACSNPISVTQTISSGLSSITGTNATADGSDNSTVTITLIDTGSNPIVGATPTFSATDTGSKNSYANCSVTNSSGVSTCTFSSTKAETKTLSITTPISLSGGTVVFNSGAASSSTSTITGTSSIIANGSNTSSVTITILDAFSNPIDSVTPTFSATDTGTTNVYNACSATNSSGVSTCTMTSTKAEAKTLSISSPVSKAGSSITFINGAVSSLSYTTQPSSSAVTDLAFGTQPVVEARDANNNLITASNIDITLSAFTNAGCTTSSGGNLSATTNPLSTTSGVSSFTGVAHDTAEGLYIQASSGGVSTCSNLITVSQRPQISFSASVLNENVLNVGTITETITLTLSNDTYTGVNSDDFVADGKVTISNVPAGLTAVLTRTSATVLTLSLTGTASSHANNDDISNLTITLLDSAFTLGTASNVLNFSKSDISVDYLDTYTLSYASSELNEAISNTGSITETLVITLSGTTFTGSNSDDFVSASKVTVTNAPAGMTATAIRDSNTQITVSLTGNATSHANANDISNLTVTFLDSAITSGSASGVTNTTKSDIVVDFIDPAILTYDVSELTEVLANTGAIGNSIVITLANDTFDSDLTGDVTFTNTPAGLTASVTRDSATQVTLTLTGNATSHANANDVTNFTIDFLAAAFTNNTVAANVTGNNKSDILINFADPASLAYSATTLNERINNDGGIDETTVITLTNDTFSTDLSGDITATNVPAGLTANFTRINDTQVLVNLSGTATNHANANDIANLTITFANDAFVNNTVASNVINYVKNDTIIDFLDPPSLTYDLGTFTENVANDGSMGNSLVINLAGDVFAADLTGDIAGSNLPAGLSASFVRDSDTQVTVSLTGNATSHANANDIANLTITFADAAFVNVASASLVTNYLKNDIIVDFEEPATLAYSSSTMTEVSANDGTITDSIVITLTGDTFDTDLTGDVTISNVPTGMTGVITRDSTTQVTLTLTGTASAHSNSNDIGNLTVTFANNAFVNNTDATNVTGYLKNDIVVDFSDPASLSYSVSTINENVANTGSVTETIVMTLTGDTFDADLTGDITATNVPTGLTAVFTRDSATQVTLSFTGNATSHANSNDISNLTVTYAASAFVNNTTASNVVNYLKNDIVVDFIDPAALAYSVTTLNESASNTGAVSETIVITLTGDTFSADLTGDISATNTPAGLTAVFTRDSSTQVTLSFTGTATAHANANDISNLTITFLAAAFVNNTVATNVTNYQVTDRAINFSDPASLSYASSALTESSSNTGAITDTLIITLTGDTFASDLTGDITATNVPAGLTAVFTRDSSTQVTASFTGTATSHANANDIVNLTITFSAAAFTDNTVASNVTNYLKNDITVDFNDAASLSYGSSSVSETSGNAGAITDTIVITLTGDTFDSNLTGDITATNTPSGLTAVFTRDSATQVTVSFSGTATSHANSNDVGNLTVTFSANAFVGNTDATNVTNYLKNDITIDFLDPASLSYASASISETSANDGSFTDTLVITLSGDTFAADLTGDISDTNTPTGLTAVFTRDSATQVTVSFTGNATSHANGDDISNLTITFSDAAFVNNSSATNVTNYNRSDISVDFSDPASLSYNVATVNESSANTGAISETFVITLSGDTFAADLTGDIAATNVPTGLTAVFTRDSATQVSVSFTGAASSHANANDVSNLTITFANAAFVNNSSASNVTNYNRSDLAINFMDPASLSYSTSSLTEVSGNTGAITDTIVITLTNDTFAADLTGDIAATNVPAGLSAVFTRDSATQVTLSFSSSATNHANANDISNLTVTFSDAAFVNNSSAINVTNYLKNDITIDFSDPASLNYGSTTVNEAVSNTGAISETMVITLTNDTFSADLTGDISATNVPTGLTTVFTRDSATQVTVSFTGTATSHANANDVGDLTITFSANAFVNNTNASNVTNYLKNDLVIDFIDPASLAYSTSTVNEAGANDGSITDTIVITLTGDTFAADITGDVSAMNVPTGLSAVFTRDSNTQVTLSFTGNATNHADVDDISNLNVTFIAAAFVNNTVAANVTNYQKADISVNFSDTILLTFSNSTFTEGLTRVYDSNTISNYRMNDEVGSITGVDSSTNLINLLPQGLGTAELSNTQSKFGFISYFLNDSYLETSDLESFNLSSNFTIEGWVYINNGHLATNSTHALFIMDQAANNRFQVIVKNDGSIGLEDDSIEAVSNSTGIISEETWHHIALVVNGTGPDSWKVYVDGNEEVSSDLGVNWQATSHIFQVGIDLGDSSNLINAFYDEIRVSDIARYTTNFSAPTSEFGLDQYTGIIENKITITLTSATFSGSNNDDFVTDAKVTVSNVPSGLTAVVTRLNDTQVEFSLTGTADNNHHINDDINNLSIQFEDTAFDGGINSLNVVNYQKVDLGVDFNYVP